MPCDSRGGIPMDKHKKTALLLVSLLILEIVLAAALIIPAVRARSDARSQAWEMQRIAEIVGDDPSLSEEERTQLYENAIGEALRCVTVRAFAGVNGDSMELYLCNDAQNVFSVSAELVLWDTGETIAATGRIDPGWYLETLHLDRLPEEGEHPCLVRLSFYLQDGVVCAGTGVRQMLILA